MNRDRDRNAGERRDEDFASRWSRMKRRTGAPALEPPAAPVPAAETTDERSDEEILRDLGLPDPEALKPGDDVRGFMAAAVPARIRNRVLRRLWTSNPVLANIDGLVDYGEDFTDAAMVPAVLQTAYKVGRGWARDAIEDESGTDKTGVDETGVDETGVDDSGAAKDESTGDAGTSEGEGSADDAGHELHPPLAEIRATESGSGPQEEDPTGRQNYPRPVARRMRFRFRE